MTEITKNENEMHEVVQKVVLHWGEMGNLWGINRSVSQIHALLYLSDKPLTAEDIALQLSMARSNVSNSLKELLGWNLITRVHVMGDRRDHFDAEKDLWEILSRIADGRKEREIDPTIQMLRDSVEQGKDDPTMDKNAQARIEEMLAFMVLMDKWYVQMSKLPKDKLIGVLKAGSTVADLLGKLKGKKGN